MLRPPQISTFSFHLLPAATTTFVRKIRNPLCIITLAYDLLMDTDPSPTQQKYLDMIKRAGVRIDHQVTALVADEIVIN